MRGQAVRGAVALAVLSAAWIVPAPGARAADCWLLEGAELTQAQAQGRCRDVFASSAPANSAPKAAKPAPAKPAKAARRAPARLDARPSFLVKLERLLGGRPAKPPAAKRTRHGGVDHLAYGRPDGVPVQR